MRHSRVSWAQQCEDIVLWRAFGEQPTGTYVDVGAGHPHEDSVTKLFYDHGWSGVNVEPLHFLHRLLVEHRPRDVNLEMGLSDEYGELTFYVAPPEQYGISTFSADNRAALETQGFSFRPRTVPVGKLTDVLARFPPGEVDFVKIDVEGWERNVLLGADLALHRPKVLVIEAVEPGQPSRNSQDWEPLVFEAGYRPTLFDGLNLFFVHRSQQDLVYALSAPANVFDDWMSWRDLREREALEERLLATEPLLTELLDQLVATVAGSFRRVLADAEEVPQSRLEELVRAALVAEPTLIGHEGRVQHLAILDAMARSGIPDFRFLSSQIRSRLLAERSENDGQPS